MTTMNHPRTLAAMLSLIATSVLPLGVVASCAVGCHKSQASQPAAEKIPPGEVWLTSQQVAEAKIDEKPLEERDVDDTIITSGKVTFDDVRVHHVYSPVTGRVVKIDAQLGQPVKKGDPLASIESPDIGSASSDLGKASADLIAAEHDYKRSKELSESHAISQKDLETSEDSFRKAKAELERAKQKAYLLRAGSADFVSQQYTLRALIDGDVIARTISPGIEVQGQYTGSGNPVEMFTIADLTEVWVFADIFELDLARVKVGAPVRVKVVAYPNHEDFKGKVDFVSGMLDPTSRTARVRCTFDNADKLLKPEMYATIYISVEERKALAIPRAALLRLGDAKIVFVDVGKTSDGRVRYERRPVDVDETEGSEWIPVMHGLEKGDKVVTSGSVLLSGML
ncbi:MAG: efflux RND transporter periplasmic adaptor subunit [Polyangiales bacterium]